MLVEGEFVEGDDVFLVAREVVAGGKCQRCGGEKRGEENFFKFVPLDCGYGENLVVS